MTERRDACEAMGPEVTALLRGELPPAGEAPVRAHLAACPSCAALAADLPRIRAAAAARPAAAPDAASRSRLAAALGAAWEAEEARERARGPVLRLLERAGRRYAESRAVRFFSLSVAAHAAAAILLGVWLHFEGGPGPRERGPIDVSTAEDLPPVYDDRPASQIPPGALEVSGSGGFDPGWDAPPPTFGGGPLPPPVDDPPGSFGPLRLYPTDDFRRMASDRFRESRRDALLAKAWGTVEGPRARLSVERGLGWLAASQEPDGTWASARPGAPRAERDRFRGGVTGTVLLAFLGDGRTPMRSGPFAGTARGALSALVRSQDPATGLLGGFARGPAADRPLCNHGPALEALAEAYGLDYGLLPAETRTSLERTIARAVEAALAAQLRDGSFGYTLRASRGDTSVTLLVVRGLEAARRAGFEVDPARLRLAGKYVASRVDAGGRLGYVEPGDRATDATLAAEALPLADALGLPGDLRARMVAAVAADQAAGGLEGRLLFRSAFLDVAGRTEDPRTAALGPAAARGTIDGQEGAGSFASGGDRYARAAGDALSTARVVRALTSPYRGSR